MFRLGIQIGYRHLMRAPRTFDGLAIHKFRSGPALRSTHDDHGPDGKARRSLAAGFALNGVDFSDDRVERRRHELMHHFWLMPFAVVGFISVASEEVSSVFV